MPVKINYIKKGIQVKNSGLFLRQNRVFVLIPPLKRPFMHLDLKQATIILDRKRPGTFACAKILQMGGWILSNVCLCLPYSKNPALWRHKTMNWEIVSWRRHVLQTMKLIRKWHLNNWKVADEGKAKIVLCPNAIVKLFFRYGINFGKCGRKKLLLKDIGDKFIFEPQK